MEDNNFLQNISGGIIDSIAEEISPFDMATSNFIVRVEGASSSIVTRMDQDWIDDILYNNLDIISSNSLFDKIKDYEKKFGDSSENFYKEWIDGKTFSNLEIQDWMRIYREILIKD